jgi:hypothetical protein
MNALQNYFICRFQWVLLPFLFLIVLSAQAQHTNVLVGDYFPEKVYYPNEPSIAINPKNTNQMIVTTNGPVNSYYYSTNGGITWNRAGAYSFDLGRWGDPCVISDTSGYFYFFHLERTQTQTILLMPDRVYCRKIACDQIGNDWSDVSYVGLNPPKMQDKEWGVWDPLTQNLYVVWSEFDVYGSADPTHFSNLLFSRSTDDGITWSGPKRINKISGDCLDESNSVMGGMPAVGPNGEVYVSWPGPAGIAFDRSTDQGITWLAEDIIVADNPAGDHYHISGISRGGSCPTIACDLSNGPYRGTIYINWSDQINGSDDTDIWLSKSSDGGNTWSQAIRVNDDPPGKHQMFHWMTVDSTNGNLYFVFYDRRNYNDDRTDVYLAVSKDGGDTFSNYKISESPFIPYGWRFMGDYSHIVAMGDIIRPVWARMDDGLVSVWTALIDSGSLTGINKEPISAMLTGFKITSIYPNPFNMSTCIRYKLPKSGNVTIKIFDILGKEIHTLYSGIQSKGEYNIHWNAAGLTSNIYIVRMEFGKNYQTRKVVIIK